MRVLYLTNKPPYPTVDGGCFAMANFMKLLNNVCDEIIHYTLATSKHPFDKSAYPDEFKNTSITGQFIDTEVTPQKALRYLFSSKSFNVDRFHDKQVENDIHQILQSTKIDCIVLESLYTTTYIEAIKKVFNGKIFVRTHNVESDIWSDYKKNASGLKKWYLSKLQKDLLKYEVRTLSKVDGILCLSHNDIERFKELDINAPTSLVHISVKVKDNVQIGKHLYFLGAMDWLPNIEAAQYILEMFPVIKTIAPEITLHIAGKGSKEKFDSSEGIVVEGFVENLDELYAKSGILVSPVFTGSGIRVKILEAMAAGIPVISTSKGAVGIDYASTECIKIADTRTELIDACVELHTNEQARTTLGTKAKAYIRSNHDEKIIATKLIEFITKK